MDDCFMRVVSFVFLVGFFFSVLSHPYRVVGEEKPPPPQGDPESRTVEVLEWKAMMAENSYLVNKTEENRFEMIVAFEEAVTQACMRDLPQTLSYAGPGNNARCKKLIAKTLELDPKSPAATCARDGIDSVTCTSSYAEQQIAASEGRSTEARKKVTEFGRQARSTSSSFSVYDIVERFGKDKELDKLEAEYRSTGERDAGMKFKLLERYREILSKECRGIKYYMIDRDAFLGKEKEEPAKDTDEEEEQRPSTFVPSEAAGGDGDEELDSESGKKIDRLLMRLEEIESGVRSQKEIEESLPSAQILRVRELPNTCFAFVTRLLRIIPLSSLGLCFREGLYSPACIQRLRTEKEEIQKIPPKVVTKESGSQSGGFSTF